MIHDAGAQNTPPVSILVLMDLCIKTRRAGAKASRVFLFQSLF